MALAFSGDTAISEESRKVIEDILKSKLDDDGMGEIGVEELEEFLYAMGFCPSKKDVTFLLKHFDKNGDGSLEVKEVMDNIDVLGVHSLHGDLLMSEFRKVDTDGDGTIRFPELLSIFTAPGNAQMEVMEARQLLDHLVRKYDTDHDGKFSYAEFVKMFMNDEFKLSDREEKDKKDKKGKKSGIKSKTTNGNSTSKDTTDGAVRKSSLNQAKQTNESNSMKSTKDDIPSYMKPKGSTKTEVPSYMRPKTGNRGTDMPNYMRPKTGSRGTSLQKQVPTEKKYKTPSSGDIPNYMRHTSRTEVPSYMRPKTGSRH